MASASIAAASTASAAGHYGPVAEIGERLLLRYPVELLEASLEMVRDGAAVTETHIPRIREATRDPGATSGSHAG